MESSLPLLGEEREKQDSGYGCWSQRRFTQHLRCWAEVSVPVDRTSLGPLLPNGPIAIAFPPTPPGWSRFCLE